MLKTLPSPSDSAAVSPGWKALFRTSQVELVPGTTKYWVRVMLAPICLLLVAGLHWYRVEFRDQTPWKGGGFAMFSTVDSPAARSMRFYLLTTEGEIVVEPPVRVQKWVGEMCAAPAQETMHIIAERMTEATWVRSGFRWRSVERETAPLGRDLQRHDHAPSGEGSVAALGIGEPPPPATEIVPIRGVRIELWRYSIGETSTTLVNRKLREYTHWIETPQSKGKP